MSLWESIFGTKKSKKEENGGVLKFELRETELPLEVHGAEITAIIMKSPLYSTISDVNAYANNEIIIYLKSDDSSDFSVTFLVEEGKGKNIHEAIFYENDDIVYFKSIEKQDKNISININEPYVTISGFNEGLEKIMISARMQEEFFKVRDTYIKKITFKLNNELYI